MALLGAQPQQGPCYPKEGRQRSSLTASSCSFKDHGGETVSCGNRLSLPREQAAGGGGFLLRWAVHSPEGV